MTKRNKKRVEVEEVELIRPKRSRVPPAGTIQTILDDNSQVLIAEQFVTLFPPTLLTNILQNTETNAELTWPQQFALLRFQDKLKLNSLLRLFNYQLDAIRFLIHHEKALLHMEMGLGKTITTLIALHYKQTQAIVPSNLPSLIVCPKSVFNEWIKAISSGFFFQIDAWKEILTSTDFKTVFNSAPYENTLKLNEYSFVITTQQSLPKLFLKIAPKTEWDCIIVDEAQNLNAKNSSLFAEMARFIGRTKTFWALSGTPIRNYEHDLTNLFVLFSILRRGDKMNLMKFKALKLDQFVFSKSIQQTDLFLPALKTTIVRIQMDDTTKRWFEEAKEFVKTVFAFSAQKTSAQVKRQFKGKIKNANLFAMIASLRCRQICISPVLTKNLLLINQDAKEKKKRARILNLIAHMDENIVDFDKMIIEDLQLEAAQGEFVNQLKQFEDKLKQEQFPSDYISEKCNQVISLVNRIVHSNPTAKIIMFSTFVHSFDLFVDKFTCEMRILKGSLPRKNREKLLSDLFSSQEAAILCTTYKLSSEGVDFTFAQHCILLDPWWSPAVRDQAIARIWRIGQLKPCFVYDFIYEHSIDELILQTMDSKREMYKSFFTDITIPDRQNVQQSELLQIAKNLADST